MNTLSIVIPAYNEEKFIVTLLEKIRTVDLSHLQFKKQIIVVDDGSADQTATLVEKYQQQHSDEIRLIRQKNQGKGSAVQRGIREATGQWVLVQDADLEYDPMDYAALLTSLKSNHHVAYGSRGWGQKKWNKQAFSSRWFGKHPEQMWAAWLANLVLSMWTFLLYQKWISDTLTAYKLYPRTFFEKVTVETKGFETDHELSAKLIRLGYVIEEVPIRYYPRTIQDGKKITWKDGLRAVWTLLYFRFSRIQRHTLSGTS